MPAEIKYTSCSTCGELIAWTVVKDKTGQVTSEGPKVCRYGHQN